eukprot:3324584-Rhodomonas_salina.1
MLGDRRKTRVETEAAIAEEPAPPAPALKNAKRQLTMLNETSAWKTLGTRFQRAKEVQEQGADDIRPFSRAS